ncbi:MAG: hypothetical protein DIJKHBIC_01036 [Thermoanaerobaculia bacterium]|nr:hypothetical protein [Thermoanaerobaculia bacterium]
MTCAELRARLVDPASAGRGGHAPVVDHLEVCPDCRTLARAFGAVERLFRPDPGVEAPAGLRDKVFQRILERAGSGAPPVVADPAKRNLLIAGIVIILLILAGIFASIRRWGGAGTGAAPIERAPQPAATAPPASETASGTKAAGALTSAPVSDDEKNLIEPILPHDFLVACDVLASLDPFFPRDLAEGPVDGIPVPERIPGEEKDLTERVINWRYMAADERQRILSAHQAFLARPEAERQALRQRWTFYRALSPGEQAGLGRVVARTRDLDPRRAGRLKTELRTIAAYPPERRASAWRNHAFGKSITGQEAAAVERLWLALP